MRRNTTLIAATALVLAACGGASDETPAAKTETPAIAPEKAAAALYIDVIDCGTIAISDLDAFSTEGDFAGQTGTFTDTCWLINHPDGRLMWDLGLPGILTQGEPQENGIFTVSLERTLTDQLLDLNLTPKDIDYLAISHSHFDHIGQIPQIDGSKWLVHEDELAAMFPPKSDDKPAEAASDQTALFALFDPLEKQIFSGDLDVFGDGSVIIMESPGHTPGHTTLLVNLPEMGPVMLSGDLYHRTESRALKRVPRFNHDADETLASMQAFEDRAATLGAKVIIQHEAADIEPLPKVLR
jgi:glyoxylase-like metal-dependent hydrolase (beta-lactamase superfamily II)